MAGGGGGGWRLAVAVAVAVAVAPDTNHMVLHFGGATVFGSSHELLQLAQLAPRPHSRPHRRTANCWSARSS